MTSVIGWSGQLPCAWAAGAASNAAPAAIAARREILDTIGSFPLFEFCADADQYLLLRLSQPKRRRMSKADLERRPASWSHPRLP
jgi:hypothetical protein